jgi:hypothetical protein
VTLQERALHLTFGIVGLALSAWMVRKYIKSEERRNAEFRVAIAEIHLLPRYVVFTDKKTTSDSMSAVAN